MDDTSLDGLRAELTELLAEQERLTAERQRLHDKIDFGFGNDETRAREREVSDARQDVHRRIEALRGRIGTAELVER
jgi:regulator of replication initiation timing